MVGGLGQIALEEMEEVEGVDNKERLEEKEKIRKGRRDQEKLNIMSWEWVEGQESGKSASENMNQIYITVEVRILWQIARIGERLKMIVVYKLELTHS